MKPFCFLFFFSSFFFEGERSRQKIIYFALISYKNVKTWRHVLFVFLVSFFGTSCHQSGLLGADLEVLSLSLLHPSLPAG